jgi:hypothetical protein
VHQVVHAFQAALAILAIGVVDEGAYLKLVLEVARFECRQFREHLGEFDVVLRKWLGLRFQTVGAATSLVVGAGIVFRAGASFRML